MLDAKRFLSSLVLFGVLSTILYFQPDAGQATVFNLSTLVLFLYNNTNIKIRLTAIIIFSLSIYLSWHKIDLLEPVSYVEDILHLIKDLGFIGITGIIIVLIFLFLPFIFTSFNHIRSVKILSASFIIYLLSSLVVTELGHFPVPVIGAGFSSVFGWFLMLSFIYKSND